ncbi:hypothetical protein [Kitasatospora paranensis]|uniref:Uncharacterized protein n=1 Tax=Kitasatospora paranensis TaxID=258053 RepID=A0ABW2FUZ6_9ACTN
MGLDVYAVRPGDAAVTGHATLTRPVAFGWLAPSGTDAFRAVDRGYPDGLMWPSDGDPTGFRGAVHQQGVEDEFGVSPYELADPAEVAALAGRVDDWLAAARREGRTEVELGAGAVPLGGIAALGRFLGAAASQGLWLLPDF